MPSRDVMDQRVDVYRDQGKDVQNNGRGNGDWGLGFGQTLLQNGKPSDQALDGPQLPANLRDDARWDVRQTSAGYGAGIVAFATEGPTDYIKVWSFFESGPYVEGSWEIIGA